MFYLKPPTTSVHWYPLPSSTLDYPSHADVCDLSSFYSTHELKHGRRVEREEEEGGEKEEEEGGEKEEEEGGEKEEELRGRDHTTYILTGYS